MTLSLCDDTNLSWNPSPLVWPDTQEYHACALTGGYDLSIKHSASDDELCPSTWLKPRLESNCMPGEGISIDYRHFGCRGDLSMDQEQQLRCLGSWTEGQYTYSVLTDADDLWPKLWMLRIPAERGISFTAELLSDIKVDRGNVISSVENYHFLEMTQRPFTSMCADEEVNCNDCTGGVSDVYCQKSCHVCDDAGESRKECAFPAELYGRWEDLSADESHLVNISRKEISASGLETLRCLEPHTTDLYDNEELHALSVVFANGCKPRYACVQLVRVAPSVLRYRLSRTRVWPYSPSLDAAADVCQQSQFADDLVDVYRSNWLTTLVSADRTTRQTVSCQINSSMQVRGYYDGASDCQGHIDPCGGDDDVISIELTGQSCPQLTRFRCLASFVEDSMQIVVTERQDESGEVHCWMFRSGDWNSGEQILYILRQSECNAHAALLIDFGNSNGHIARLATSDKTICRDGVNAATKRTTKLPKDHNTPLGESIDVNMVAGCRSRFDVIWALHWVIAFLVLAGSNP